MLTDNYLRLDFHFLKYIYEDKGSYNDHMLMLMSISLFFAFLYAFSYPAGIGNLGNKCDLLQINSPSLFIKFLRRFISLITSSTVFWL
jgi:hypothetical protein